MDEHGNIYYVYSLHPHNGEMHRRITGKFVLDENGVIHVLEDHAGLLEGLDEMDSDKASKHLQSLQDSMYTEIVNINDIASGNRPDLVESIPGAAKDESEEQTQAITYQYHRIGMQAPQELKFENGAATLDGHQLSDLELGKMVENLRSQKATLQRCDDMSNIAKSELMYKSLAKADPELSGALHNIRAAAKAGAISPEALRILTSHIFKDSMVPSMGNKKAYEDFMSRPKAGVHIRLDGNDFGNINKVHGFEAGNEAIKHMFNSVRSALDESVGRKNAKSFRIGGDEGHVYVPTHQHAAAFVRNLKSKLAAIPPVGGTHGLSMSVGVGNDAATAEHALIQAKTAKKASSYPMGQAKTHAYSATPGFEGHLATE